MKRHAYLILGSVMSFSGEELGYLTPEVYDTEEEAISALNDIWNDVAESDREYKSESGKELQYSVPCKKEVIAQWVKESK